MKTTRSLTQEMINRLNQSPLISLITVDPENLRPQINAISWIRANADEQKIRIAVGHQSECLTNMEKGSPVTLGWMDINNYYMLNGPATLSELKKGTMKYRIIEMTIESMDNVMFYGGVISQIPLYHKTYDPELAKKIDQEIDQALEEGWSIMD